MKHISLLFITLLLSIVLLANDINYSDSWGKSGLSVKEQSSNSVKVNFSISNFSILNTIINGKGMQEISLPDVFLPAEEGAPNLPGTSRYIAVPNGASAKLEIINFRTEIIESVEIVPSPRIPWDTEKGPLEYTKNEGIYSIDSFYPQNPFKLSEKTEIRGIEAVMLGITPFQYNPVTKELKVYRDIEVEISFTGGNDNFGEERLRSRWWDPIISDIFLNELSIPEVNYNHSFQGKDDVGCEYLIITPNNPEFQSWADSIKQFRTLQGILTDVIPLSEVGGNTSYTIENYINNAYNTWDIVPAAVLLLGDYGTNAANSIISPIWNSYCASDNIYADVTNNSMPDIVFARITANNEDQLETMITKFLNYERTPPTSPDFYDHPITALGWQTERWFQICSETIGGYWKNVLGKDPVRINAIYEGNPTTDPWSTATNTYTVLNTFGPNNLNYIPNSPNDLGDWTGGNASQITTAINNGSFALQHRDHGYEQGWGEPDYASNDINNLTNTDLTFIFSVNCLTGKYNLASTCFTETFHQHKSGGVNSGALGLIAASEVSYSFVNDAYVWGMYDNLWPDFLPQYGSTPDHRGVLPAYGNAAGKYFLQQSNWPYNSNSKEVTYNLFHHHGDAFLTLYTEVPEDPTVLHSNVLLEGIDFFTVLADEGSLIGITVNGEIIATENGTGEPLQISIPAQTIGSQLIVTVTKLNNYRYQSTVEVIDSNTPFVVQEYFEINDESGNNDGLLDYGESIMLDMTLQNIGTLQATNVSATLSTLNEFITITDDSESYGDFIPGGSISINDAFAFDVDYLIPDNENVLFDITTTDGSDTWTSQIIIKSYAPVLEFVDFVVSDPAGNNNGRIDPGETVEITVSVTNSGSSEAFNVMGEITSADPYITINTGPQSYGNLTAANVSQQTFSITADASTPEGYHVSYDFEISGDGGINGSGSFATVIGRITALVLDLDTKNYSGPGIYETLESMDVYSEYLTSFPEDLDNYKNIFVCLGLHFTNYELFPNEGQALKDFLLNGGNIWLEGRVTWKEDPQTPVHSMFNIEVDDQNMFVYTDIIGVDGTIAGGTSFVYDGHNPVGNYAILPVYPAASIFTIQDPFHSCAVAYNAGDYRTIGTTFEFGKLLDDVSPSTKVDLMQNILSWFDGTLTSIDDISFSNLISMEHLQSLPNPFNKETILKIIVEKDSPISLNVFNLQGELIHTILKNKDLKTGTYEFVWKGLDDNGNQLPNGIYFGVLHSSTQTNTIKLILSK